MFDVELRTRLGKARCTATLSRMEDYPLMSLVSCDEVPSDPLYR